MNSLFQASTDILNDVDRASIDLEFQSLKGELTSIANVTEYNDMNVLNGTYQKAGGASTSSQWPLPEIPITRDSIHTNGHQDIFVHDRETGATERVSVHTNGTQGNGESRNPNISDDGRSILFDSDASNLVNLKWIGLSQRK